MKGLDIIERAAELGYDFTEDETGYWIQIARTFELDEELYEIVPPDTRDGELRHVDWIGVTTLGVQYGHGGGDFLTLRSYRHQRSLDARLKQLEDAVKDLKTRAGF